jgi:uncharacterized protein YcfL
MKSKLLISFLLILAACNSNKPMTEEQKTTVKEEGSVVVNELFDAIKTSNVERLLKLLENSPDYAYIVAGEVYTYDQQVEMASQYVPNIERQTFITKFEKYIIIDPSCFEYIWQGDNGMYMKTGDSTILKDYLLAYTFRKSEGTWKLVLGHESQKVPLPIDTTMMQ